MWPLHLDGYYRYKAFAPGGPFFFSMPQSPGFTRSTCAEGRIHPCGDMLLLIFECPPTPSAALRILTHRTECALQIKNFTSGGTKPRDQKQETGNDCDVI